MEINKEKITEFRSKAQKLLDDLGDEMGFDVLINRVTCNNNKITTKIEAKVKDINGRNFEQVVFDNNCKQYGLTPEDYNMEIIHKGEKFKMESINKRAYKYPFKVSRISDGKRFKFSNDIIQKNLKYEKGCI